MIDEFDNKYRAKRYVLSALDRVRAKVPLEPVAFRSAILQHLDAVARELDLEWYGERGLSETVLRSDEVTREAISFARGPVVIEITDEQAAEMQINCE